MRKTLESRDNSRSHYAISEISVVLVMTILGGWLRFKGLGRDSLWFDETVSAMMAHRPLTQLLHPPLNVHPPFYYLLLRGVLILGDSETLLRVPSALFGTLSIPLLYLLGRAWFCRSAGALAALLLTLSPVHLWHSQDAKMYTLLTFEGILSWYLFTQLLEAPRLWTWAGYVVTSEAILYTHYYGAFLLLPQTGLLILLLHRGEVERSFWSRWLIVQGGLILLFLPWMASAGPSIRLEHLRWISRERHTILQLTKALAHFSGDTAGNVWLRGLRVLPVLALAGVALIRDTSRHWRTPSAALRERPILLCLGYFAAPIVGMVAIALVRPLLVPRHLLMTLPAFFLLVAVGLSRLLPDRVLIGGSAVLVLVFLPGLMHNLSAPRTPDYRGAATLIEVEAQGGDVVLFTEPSRYLIFEYYMRGHELQFRMCPKLVPDSSLQEIQRCLSDTPRVWVVGSRYNLRRAPTFQAPLEERFRRVWTHKLTRLRVTLYVRVR